MNAWVAVKMVAQAPLSWGQTNIEPGDVFELEEADLSASGVDPEFWLRCGAAVLFEEPAAPIAQEATERPSERRGRGSGTAVRHGQENEAPPEPAGADEAVSGD